MGFLGYLFGIVTGMMNPVQSGANAELKKALDAPLWAAVAVYVTGLAGILLGILFVREALPDPDRIARAPWWAWLGGLLSIGSTLAALMLAKQLGSGVFTGLSVTASLVTSVALDHFGLVGFEQHSAGWGRLIGCVLMITGLWMIGKF